MRGRQGQPFPSLICRLCIDFELVHLELTLSYFLLLRLVSSDSFQSLLLLPKEVCDQIMIEQLMLCAIFIVHLIQHVRGYSNKLHLAKLLLTDDVACRGPCSVSGFAVDI